MYELTAHFTDDIQAISRQAWNRLASDDYPFLRHEFLSALEASGSVAPETGWTPLHLTLRNAEDDLVGIMPAYLKDNSYGEYVFDWAWADAYYRHGLEYYPKLLTAIPFTPCVGPRLQIDPKYHTTAIYQQSIQAVIELCQANPISSWHLLFPPSSLVETLDQFADSLNLMRRIGTQYHWYNQGHSSFADYLQSMTSRKRKSIRREREKIVEQGITFCHVGGHELSPAQLDDFYLFYHATYYKRGQQGYLNQPCFELLVESMPESLHFVFAQHEGKNIAAALFLQGGDTIYGRYWGCFEAYKHLHFETCYYQGIEYCITHNLRHFDAGAQGEHKIQRGFEPIQTHSYHWLAHPGFRDAVGDFLAQEQEHVAEYIVEARDYLPFKQG